MKLSRGKSSTRFRKFKYLTEKRKLIMENIQFPRFTKKKKKKKTTVPSTDITGTRKHKKCL